MSKQTKTVEIETIEPMSLREWISHVGIEKIARMLRVHVSSVDHWRNGHCLPRAQHMCLIKKHSRGAVSYTEMIEGFKKIRTQKERKKRARRKARELRQKNLVKRIIELECEV